MPFTRDICDSICYNGGIKTVQGLYETCRDNDRYPVFWEGRRLNCMPHFHSSVEVGYVTAGKVQAKIGGRSCPVEAGRMFLVSSCTPHAYSAGRDSSVILLIVPLGFIPLYAPLLSKKVFSKSVSSDAFLNSEALHCLRMLLVLGKCSEENENIIRSYIYVILGLAIRRVGLSDTAPAGKFLLRDILLYLQDHYLCPVTLEQIAKKFGYSQYRFSHIFNRCLGCTLTQYVESLRARHAATLLRESDAPLMEIALDSGFNSIRTFYRCFKTSFGMTPTKYRESFLSSQ